MRISDWSSDVCSSDLEVRPVLREEPRAAAGPDDPAADGGGGDVQARRAIGRASGSTSWRGHRAASCCCATAAGAASRSPRSEEHTSELQSLMRISYAVFCLNKKIK